MPTDDRCEILRDEWGIPHIWAPAPADALYGQGRAQVLDRAWQLEYLRLRAEGRTAEVFGPVAVDWDRFARRCGMHRSARSVYLRSSTRTRELLDAFVAGVNSGLDAATSLELEELAHRPAPWEPWTPISVFLMHHVLFGHFTNKLWRVHAARAFGRDGLRLFGFEGERTDSASVPDLPDDDTVAGILAELDGASTTSSAGTPPADAHRGERLLGHGAVLSGSNAWALTAAHTSTGGPVVAADPHRFLELPGIYLQCHLACPEFDVVGLAFAGVPGVAHFAHTGEVAWAITNAMGDCQDLFLERLARTGDRVSARTCDGPADVTAWDETISVRGHDDEPVEIVVTGNGPVVLGGPDDAHAVSLRSPLLADEGFGFDAVVDLLFATSTEDVEQALTGWSEPVNRIVIADRAGRVRCHLAGAVPERAPENYWLPVPGWQARHQWGGYRAASVGDDGYSGEVPGRAVIANQRVAGNPSLQPLTAETAPPDRADRISALLDGLDDVSVGDCADIQHDTHLDEATLLTGALGELPDHDGCGLGDGARRIRARLLAWDRSMAADSVEAFLYADLRSRLVTAIAHHEATAGLREPHGFSAFLDPWFLPQTRIADGLAAVLDRLPGLDLPAVLARCLTELSEATGGGDDAPTWGERHRFAPIHGVDLIGATPEHAGMLARLRPDPVPLGGDAECVLANASAVGLGDACRLGPAARVVWDLAARDRSVWVVPLGASGDPGTGHHRDQLARWAAGGSIPVVSDWDALRAGREPLTTTRGNG